MAILHGTKKRQRFKRQLRETTKKRLSSLETHAHTLKLTIVQHKYNLAHTLLCGQSAAQPTLRGDASRPGETALISCFSLSEPQ